MAQNIIGFLARQNYEFDHTISSLTEVKSMLAGARSVAHPRSRSPSHAFVSRHPADPSPSRTRSVRNYDLATSLSVLTSGTYTRLPTGLTDAFRKPPTLSDELALRTLAEVDEVLRWRLVAVEKVPAPMIRQGWTVGEWYPWTWI